MNADAKLSVVGEAAAIPQFGTGLEPLSIALLQQHLKFSEKFPHVQRHQHLSDNQIRFSPIFYSWLNHLG
jgi:hypothetical protein